MRNIFPYLVFALIIFQPFNLCHAKEVWEEAEGEAAIAGITAEQAILLALQRARAAAIEKASGVQIRSETLIRNALLSGEFIKSFSKGYITEEKYNWDTGSLQESPDKPPIITYKVKLKAKVVVPERDVDLGFLLETKLNRAVFKTGEKAKISVKPTKDAYIAIFNWTADDRITLLFPNQYLPNNFVKAGTWFEFPSEKSGVALKVKTLPKHRQDTEALYVVAFDKKTGTSIPFYSIFPSGASFKVAEFFSKYVKLPIEKAVEEIMVYEVREEN